MSLTRSNNLQFLSSYIFFMLILVKSFSLNSDGTLLLSFKYSIISDPLLVLDNWNYTDETPCLWTGVTCAAVETFIGTEDIFHVIGLVLPNSNLTGSIPEELGFIQHLRTLDLSNNFFNGSLPSSLFNASEIQVLALSNNAISGEIPEVTEGLINSTLQLINLSNNVLSGKIPKYLSFLKNLRVVSFKNNYFSGNIPSGFQFVEVLDFSFNFLNETLPFDFGGESLSYLNLSHNKFSGLVSPEFAKKIPFNATIDLSFNNFTGEIPQSMALSNQKTESFIGNKDLCGKPLKNLCTVPSTLSTPPNVTTNNTSPPAIAAIPKTIGSTPLPNSSGTQNNETPHRLKPGTIAGIAIGTLAGIGFLGMILLYVYHLKKKKKTMKEEDIMNEISENRKDSSIPKDTRGVAATWSCISIANGGETSETNESESDEDNKNGGIGEYDMNKNENYKKERSLVMVDNGETKLELETLLKASAYILGSNGMTIVYKAVLGDGTTFAVRRIGEGGVEKLKEFENQVKVIARMKHPNLVRVRGFYRGNDEKLVICDYVSNGSLASASYRKIGSSPYHLPFEIRLKIAIGVARGLTYIHEKKHVHGNIKPTNILLTPEMDPIISDFGLNWLLSGKIDGSTRHFDSKRCEELVIGGSLSPYLAPVGVVGCKSPYHAPESLNNLKPNPKWDVYSFGIVLIELLTGKVFSDREIGQWTTDFVVEEKNRVLRMADLAIRADVEARQDATLACFKLGFSCVSLVPQKRPSMKDALQVLEKIPSLGLLD